MIFEPVDYRKKNRYSGKPISHSTTNTSYDLFCDAYVRFPCNQVDRNIPIINSLFIVQRSEGSSLFSCKCNYNFWMTKFFQHVECGEAKKVPDSN